MTDTSRNVESSILPRLDPEEAGYLREELEDLRALVSRGDPLTVSGGLVMAWWALVLLIGNLIHVLEVAGFLHTHLPLPATEVVIGYLGNLLFLLRRHKPAHERSWRSRTLAAMWFIGGVAVLVFVGGCYMAGIYDPRLSLAFVAMLYAIIMTLTALIAAKPWMTAPAIGWAAVAFAVFCFNSELFRPALFAGASLFLMLVPGLVLTWQERRTVV